MTEDELYFYNSDDLLSEVQRKGDATTSYIKENITYDNFGNITKKVLTAGSDSRETNFEYESTGRFLKKSIDIEGLATSFVYNADGTLKSKTDPFSQTTSYEYDSWFKRTKETDHLGFVIDFSYVKSGSGFFLAKKGSDGSVENGRFDDLSRKTIAGFKNIMGSYTYISNFYDNYDRIHKVSDPYINDNSYRLNKTEYDTYGRVFKYTEVTGKITDISYSGLTTTISDGIKNETYIKNAFGKVNSLSDSSSNVINYTYYPNGNIKEVDYGGIKTKNLQDGWGRRKQLTDPSADVIKYTYNDFGDVLTEENKNGTTTYVRNGLGKVTSKTISGNKTNSKTTYTYDPNSKLLLQSKFEDLANGSNTVVTNYKYDKDKIIKVTETTPYAIFERRFKYDGLGRIEYENATAKIGSRKSSKTVKNTYKYGFHYQILDSITNAVVWQTNSIDSRGQLLGAQSGPATLTNMYDTYGFAKQFKFDKTSPLSNILTMDYSYDTAKSNFISRTNTLFGWSESFDFDSKDRLTKFNNNQGTQETQSYDDKGRIIQNSLGTYNYNITDKPYQNSSITLENEPAGYYNNREGIFSDSMEDKSGWGAQKSPNTNFFSYDSTKPSHSVGKNTLKLTNTTTTEQYVFSDKWIDISNSVATQYTYSAWVFSDNPQAEIFLYMKDAANTVSQVSTVNNIKGKWIPISGTFLVPASIKKLCLRLDNNGQGNIWFDDVQIRKTSNAVIAAKELEIFYNIFKSPEQIEETGVEKINFVYNDNNQRSTMFYGSLDATKTARPLRKHYSGDGTMEIKENINTNEVEFVTYIGGDGYSAPAVVKSDGNTQNYLYLQRDYQGSILAITDATGNLVEKRLFDAWGGIIKVQDGTGKALSGLTVLERGYTGHEHIQSVGLINMNGRLYDPKLRRFLQPDNNIQDPLNIQNFNRYGYVLNNPLKYTDPTGEFWNFVAMGLAAYIYGGAVTGEANPLKWNMNNVMGALSGIGSGLASSYATGRTNSYIDSYNNKQVLGASAVSQGQITNKDIVNFFGDMSDGYNNGLNDRVTEVYNFADHQATDPIYWYNTVSSYKNDFINGRSLLNASKEYQKEIFDNVVGMSVYDWSYTAGYSAPDLAVSLATPYAAEGIVRSIENVGLSVENSLRRGILKNFSLHPRIANPYFSNVGEATKGFGFNQYDAAHRASTFLRDDIIMHGSFGIKDYKTIYFNYSTGSQNFSTAANPWTRTIYHEAPGIIR
jgi:RHS repeat-associated protein